MKYALLGCGVAKAIIGVPFLICVGAFTVAGETISAFKEVYEEITFKPNFVPIPHEHHFTFSSNSGKATTNPNIHFTRITGYADHTKDNVVITGESSFINNNHLESDS